MDLDLKELKRMLREELSKKLDASEAVNVIMSPQISYNEDYEAEKMEEEAESLREQLREGDYSEISLPLKLLLKANGIAIDENSLRFKRLCHQALIDSIDFYEIEAKRARGDYAFERNLLLPDRIDSAVAAIQAGASIKPRPFKEVADEFIGDLKCSIKQQGAYGQVADFFIEVEGNLLSTEIKPKHVDHFYSIARQMPPNRNKDERFRGKGYKEIISMKPDRTLDDFTLYNYQQKLGGILNYAVDNEYMGKSPITDRNRIPKPKSDKDAFEIDELKSLFHSTEYFSDTHKRAFEFWLPVVALFTGARENELAQLACDDVYEDEGVWAIDINERPYVKKAKPDERKRLKNEASKRVIPLHPFLLELGFPQFVQSVREEKYNNDRIFQGTRYTEKNGFTPKVTQWFTDYRRKCGVQDGKNFHSFRYCVAHTLSDAGIPDNRISQLLGHEIGGEAEQKRSKRKSSKMTAHYAGKRPIEIMLDEVVMELRYELDLSHLKRSRFARCGSQ